ncbi:DUF2333 family protein [Pseudomonas abyssi]|uniref:DUF2333 family protein n=1 Tax=Pseudomonas abyssi TaxID=170540 RepID=A0A395R8B9_9PSED|nr:DUF2333 family protein [Halopseudomonas gallaeciensis]RGP56303.1 hypothetical protein ASB58_02690 [Halopseudomonas gallaeciensis]
MAFGKGRSSTQGTDRRWLSRLLLVPVLLLVVILTLVGWYWSMEPGLEPVAGPPKAEQVAGEYTARTLRGLVLTLLDKPGGYLSNDIMPPGVLMDNMPRWEYGVLVQVRDMTRALRRDMARSQSQSTEDRDLVKAEPRFHFDNDSWAMPASESEYRDGVKALDSYIARLRQGDANFYSRADNLSSWVSDVSTRLGSLSQRLSASVGRAPLTDGGKLGETTPWLEIDNVFYESRGTAWALVQLLRAVEHDFGDVLEKKNALVSLQQIIRELEATQQTLWSPMVLNGDGFGVLANHSLVMANYLSRANAGLIELHRLLEQG